MKQITVLTSRNSKCNIKMGDTKTIIKLIESYDKQIEFLIGQISRKDLEIKKTIN